jgi:nucleotide-binding universal stress UspA family protein
MALATYRLTPPLDWIPVAGAELLDGSGGPMAAHGQRAGAPTKGDVQLRRRSVLHPTDYSDASQAAFEVACELAGAGGLVTVLHVAEPPYVPLGMVPLPPPRPGYRAAWESQLRMVRPSDPAVGVEHRLAEGWPAPEILHLAQESPSDLIIMGARRRGRLHRALAGSVSGAVVRKSGCAVATLTVPERWPTGLKPKGVLFATDHPEPDAYAFGLAHRIARSSAGELTVLYIPSALRPRRAERAAAEWRRLTAAVPDCRLQVQPGATTEEVLRAASALSFGLVVMSAWGRSPVRELFDPAAAVRRSAPCPVLTVYAPVRAARAALEPGPPWSDVRSNSFNWSGRTRPSGLPGGRHTGRPAGLE